MKRTTIYFDGDLELRIKTEVQRRKQPMAEFVREAVEAYLTRQPAIEPPGAGAFSSGHRGTAAEVDAALAETGFGGHARAPKAKRARRPVKRRA
jgi:hypothetical protein